MHMSAAAAEKAVEADPFTRFKPTVRTKMKVPSLSFLETGEKLLQYVSKC